MIEELLEQQKALRQRLIMEEGQRKAMEADLEAASKKLRELLDEQLKRVAEDALRGKDDQTVEAKPDRVLLKGLRQAKQLDDLVIVLTDVTDGRLTVERAGTVWRLINGNTPIESIRIVREGGKDRMIIEGPAKKHRRIILEIPSEDGKSSPWKLDRGGTPPGGASPHRRIHTAQRDRSVRPFGAAVPFWPGARHVSGRV
jgi:hypothetical protein